MASPGELPPGWQAEWDQNYQRHIFIQTTTGHRQWEFPENTAGPGMLDDGPVGQAPDGGDMHQQTAAAPAPGAPSKRRHYAANQSQAYYGTSEDAAGGAGYGGYGGGAPVAPQGQQPSTLFTPGLAADNQFAAQQQGQGGQPGYFQQPQEPHYINGPQYGQHAAQPPYVGGGGQGGVDQLAGQFGQMGIAGQKPFALHTINLMADPPQPLELQRPPPEVRLPPNACLSNSRFALPDPGYQRLTLNAIPPNNSLLNKTKLPLALVITPYKTVKEGEDQVPLVTDTIIARCRRCRGYISPFVTFIDGGNRWRCPMCNLSNETPQLFDWDQERNVAADRWQRADLNHAVVDHIAPTEYMVRPPQPPMYAFLLDITQSAVQSGMLATAARALLESLDRIPNSEGRTRVAIIGFDSSLHFFTIAPGSSEFSMLVVSDIEDVFLPKPQDILVGLTEARAGLEALLGRFNDMFQGTHQATSALGPAMQAAFKLISASGGKIVVLTSTLPTIGVGALKMREDPKVLGTAKESSLLQPAATWYKTFAIECSRMQVSVDMFLFSSGYTDVASLGCLPHYTSGQTYFYPAFNAARPEDAIKFAREFGDVIAQPLLYEAVIRVRATKGLRMSGFHGNFFVRSTDLLAMPTVPQDQSYVIEITIDDPIQQPYVVIQTGLLHSTSTGERRIRVITSCIPVTSNISEIYASADQVAIATYLADKAVERSISSKLEDARDAVVNKLTDILSTYKSSMTTTGGGASAQLALCDNMKLLPLLALGILKHVAIRQSTQIPSDLRAYAQALMTSLPHQLLMPYIHPTFYSLHNMPPECGTVQEGGVILPIPLPLTSERLERYGLYLIEDGQTMFLWVGRDAVPQLIMDVFDLPNYETLRSGKMTLPILENAFSQRVNAIIAKTREMKIGPYYPHLYVVKEDGEPPLRLWALSCLIQDRFEQLPSYQQFLNTLKEKVNAGSYS